LFELVRHNAEDIRNKALAGDYPVLQFLPVLETSGFIVKGFSHLISGYPKSGKTTLLAPLTHDWSIQGDAVLYFTEEPELAWAERLRSTTEGWNNVNLVFALGSTLGSILEVIEDGTDTVVIVDTIRLLGFNDENDNAEINRVLSPLISLCREKNQTLILAHHTRKTGGNYGMAAAGGHAIVGIVDIVLEVSRVPKQEDRRRLRGWGRIIEVPDIVYEYDGKTLTVLESVTELEEEALSILTSIPARTRAILKQMDDPKPSLRGLTYALERLAKRGKIERHPPIDEGSQPGVVYQWSV